MGYVKDFDPRWEQVVENRKNRAQERERQREEALKQKEIEKKKRRARARKAEQERFEELDRLKKESNEKEEIVIF